MNCAGRAPHSTARHRQGRWLLALVPLGAAACGGTLDVGSDSPHGLLPVDERNPIVLSNDGAYDNWQGEYALLLESAGSPPLAGIIVSASSSWPAIDVNIAGWRALVAAARESGMRNVPDPLASISVPLTRPSDGTIDSTLPNRSEGARFIVDASQRLSTVSRPLIVATGTRLTDLADAYLIDHSVTDRVVVVSELGMLSSEGGIMSEPNGDLDPWADLIVARKFRYVQVSAYYDQTVDVPDSALGRLPANELGAWIAAKRLRLDPSTLAVDQISVLASALPGFVLEVERVSQQGSTELAPGDTPTLTVDASGQTWLVTSSTGELAATRLWQLLSDKKSFGQ